MFASMCKMSLPLFICFYLQLATWASARNQQGDLSADLVPTPGHGVNPKHKVDEHRHRRNNSEGSSAFVGGGTLQTVSQMPEVEPPHQSQPPALCRALCDFNPNELNLEDTNCCLGFQKVWLSSY